MLDSVCDVLKEAHCRGWISARDGNASVRLIHEDFFHTTPSGVRKHKLDSESFFEIGFDEKGNHVILDKNKPGHPTGEILLHAALQRRVQENRVVLHLHPTYLIAALYKGLNLEILAQEFPEINRYTKVGPSVGIIPPISRELAQAATDALNLSQDGSIQYDIIGLDRHGVIAVGNDPWVAFEHIERLEHICQIVLVSGVY
jgi:ribulose-5-phosphate 4-epimerase/fuculose-1-phosphate aldolase